MRMQVLQQNFYLIQLGMGALFLGIAWIFFRPKTPESNFKVREADLDLKFKKTSSNSPDLAKATIQAAPLQLGGIRLDGTPHQILGVRSSATREEIQRAYRELMKRHHPDKVGRPGTREWQDAQKIAEALNRAKTTLLGK